ncbi:MAG: hypothetical protein KC964_29760, partial [Candidatus Omnitrophica bacterium]|nr:hypothetical protein [Candidatus Omnitrophota bacterium]
YSFDLLPPGNFRVFANSHGHGWAHQDVQVGENESIKDLDLLLGEGGDALFACHDAESGKPLESTIHFIDENGERIESFNENYDIVTPANGIPPGKHTILVRPQLAHFKGYWHGPAFYEVEVEPNTTKRIEVSSPRACRFRPLFMDSEGESVAGIDLQIIDSQGRDRAKPPFIPAFTIYGNEFHLEPGEYRVLVEKEGFDPFEKSLEIKPGTHVLDDEIVLTKQ